MYKVIYIYLLGISKIYFSPHLGYLFTFRILAVRCCGHVCVMNRLSVGKDNKSHQVLIGIKTIIPDKTQINLCCVSTLGPKKVFQYQNNFFAKT